MIRIGAILTCALMATACQAKTSEPLPADPPGVQAPVANAPMTQVSEGQDKAAELAKAQTPAPPVDVSKSAASKVAANTATERPNIKAAQAARYTLDCEGVAKQGGAMLCVTSPNAKVSLGRSETQADASGHVIIGFDRDAKPVMTAGLTHSDGHISKHTISVESRTYVEQRIDGLPSNQVSEYSEQALKRIRASSARKRVGFASKQEVIYLTNGFDYPVRDFVKTSPFGSRRILNGTPKKPHYGVDIAAPLGTPIYAPADGVVALADDDLYFEGAMVMLDHGQGLTSLYLHVNAIFVQPGDTVKRGDKIAEIGSKGRSTGPHLCWRLKWRKENLDPELLTQWPGR